MGQLSAIPFFSFLCSIPNLLLLLLFCLFIPATSMPTGMNQTDQDALLALKSSITHDPFQLMSSWNKSIHFCHWGGITCSRRRERVIMLDLNSQKLEGTLPPNIGNLSFLRVLNLLDNSFSREIPQEIGRLFRLQALSLGNNSFSGHFPVNISRCSNLLRLDVGGNKLEGEIPMELGTLKNLQVLFLYRNSFIGNIPPSIGNLSSLQAFSATWNYLEGDIPGTLGQLKNLKGFAIGANNLTGTIPFSLYNLSSIRLFSVTVNRIHGSLPPDFGLNLPSLETLHISSNELSGVIPVSLTNASKLLEIDVGGNQFTGKVPDMGNLDLRDVGLYENDLGSGEEGDLDFVSSLVNCTNLEMIAISDNNFGGVMPSSMNNLSSTVEKIVFGRNQIRGSIPSGIGNLIGLKVLGLEKNQLTGTIPYSIGKLRNLGALYISKNNISGRIPDTIGNITSLSRLSMGFNNLQGSIPRSIGRCQNVLIMVLPYNNLSGPIPEELVSLASLSQCLDLSHNRFTGSLPSEVGKLTNLGYLDVSWNRISGEVPSSLGSCTSLETLRLEDNFFDGVIPASLSSLRALQDFDISCNNLSGEIPKFLEGFVLLQNLNLSFNNFQGEVPIERVFKNKSVISVTGNTMLCGGIPELKLPPCTTKGTKDKKTLSLKLKLVISIVSILVGLSLFLCFLRLYCLKKKPKEASEPSHLNTLMNLSYHDILSSTGGFSSANLIGSGAFGSVYKGILDQDEKMVAVKVLNLHKKGASKSFMAECEAMRNIRHRNLVKTTTACSSVDFQGNDFKALVYEFMVNGSLEEWLHPLSGENGKLVETRYLSLLQRLNIGIDVACAIDYLHNRLESPIVHCDMKPSNILLDEYMNARVGDFGLARLLPTSVLLSASQTSSLGIKGTVGYAAPEYGMGSEVSVYGDVYSYGILLLEIFTVKRPTDDMFADGLDLHKFAVRGLPDRVTEIVDPRLCEEIEIDGFDQESRSRSGGVKECLISIVRIGIRCSVELPRERMAISDVVNELQSIKNHYFFPIERTLARRRDDHRRL